jgi:Transposase DDE domain group 1
LQDRIGYLLKRPVGRPPHEVRRYFASFGYRAQSWNKSRHVVAKVEWHPGALCPRVGFIVSNLARSAEGVVVFYNQRGTAEQCIKEGKGAIKWTRLSCRTFGANAVRLQLHALAYNLGNFVRTLAIPKMAQPWSLTSPAREADQDRRKGRQSRALRDLPDGRSSGAATDVRRHPVADRPAARNASTRMRATGETERATTPELRPDAGGATRFSTSTRSTKGFDRLPGTRRDLPLLKTSEGTILISR